MTHKKQAVGRIAFISENEDENMPKKRGGGRGQPSGAEKRKATTPVGGVYKDVRRNITSEDNYEDDEGFTLVISNKQKNQPRQSDSFDQSGDSRAHESTTNMSFADAVAGQSTSTSTSRAGPSARRDSASSRGQRRENETGEHRNRNFVSKFVTSPPEGSWRDEIVVEVQRINGAKFIGQLGFKEAKYNIFQGCLHLDPLTIHGLRFGFSDYPVVKFKLKEKINVDSLISTEFFTFKRQYLVGNKMKTDEIDCKIRGIRASGQTLPPDADPSTRWVKVEWSEYSLRKDQMMAWLELYGEKAGELSEDVHPDSDSDVAPIGSGTYSVKMKLKKDIPQMLPMFGKRIRVYYRGVQKLCTKCFGNHNRLHCRNDKVRWIDYVLKFIEDNPDIPEEMYGRWWQVVNEEFGPVISETEERDRADDDIEEVMQTNQLGNEPTQGEQTRRRPERLQDENSSVRAKQSNSGPEIPERKLTSREEEELADFLDVGLSVTEARMMRQKEEELAALKLKIRENKRATNRGAISGSTRNSETRIGPWGMPSRRGGLNFN